MAGMNNPGSFQWPKTDTVPSIMEPSDPWGTPLSRLEFPDQWAATTTATMMPRVSPMSMLAMRMRWGVFGHTEVGVLTPTPYDFITAFEAAEKMFIFVVKNDQAVTLEDDKMLFPSDGLVTQLKLLEQEKLP